ncbi:hypothetical protein CCOS2040_06330 [Streptomyces albidoflavus]|nr:hypothetical protein CCOS2040_06330 [Streptomyces albidoflavus]
MPSRPWPPPGGGSAGAAPGAGVAAGPPSRTVISTCPSTGTMLTSARAPGPACLWTLVSASCTTRYAARSTAAGSGSPRSGQAISTGRPALRNRSARSSRRARPGAGSVGASGSPLWRSRPTVARSSSSAERLASRTWASASLAWSGLRSMTWAATPAWTLTRAMWWATTSCRSRAIRSRSSATRRRASSSRVRSARSARSWMAVMYARLLRTASPAAAARPSQAKMPKFSWAYQGRLPQSMAPAVRPAEVSRPIRQVVGRSVRAATV